MSERESVVERLRERIDAKTGDSYIDLPRIEARALLAAVEAATHVEYAEHGLHCRSQYRSKHRGPCNCANGRLDRALERLICRPASDQPAEQAASEEG